MFKPSKKRFLLLFILVFSFAYRLLLMLWAGYPPGADIGLHNSVIYSITRSGTINFLSNNYQMGGGLSLTFPGYHIFVSTVILMTGIPDFIVHSLVVSLFSVLIVATGYLITRKIWGESTSYVVAFLLAISRFDIEMLLWGGYPNVVTLALIPLVFYFYLQRDRFSLFPFLTATALLSGAIYLTHSLSAVMFVSITLTVILSALILSRTVKVPGKHIVVWALPVFLGALIVSPFLVNAVPAYLGANSETFTGGVSDIRQALLSTRVLPAEIVLPLFACVILFFLFSRAYKGRYLTVPALLLALWIVVPMLFTQGYWVGLFTDYNRFLYFVLLPLVILIGIVVDHGARLLAQVLHTYLSSPREKPQPWRAVDELEKRLQPYLSRKNIYSGFLVGLLLFLFLTVQLFLTPYEGTRIQGFYQVMDDPGYEAVQWARENTPRDSVFVSDALYGWWFGGFAQRPTLSAVDPQYLILSREFAPAKAAKSLLDTDYVIDNGLIQVREDGGYIGRHNPMFLAKLNWTYFPYAFFNFNNNEAEVKMRIGDTIQSFDVLQLPVREMRVESDAEQAIILVNRGNSFFNYTQQTTVYRGVGFVNMSIAVESDVEGISVDWIRFIVNIKGEAIIRNNTVGLLDEGVKVLGQLIFAEQQPSVHVVTSENPSGLLLDYNLQGKSKGEIQLLVGVLSVTDDLTVYQDPETKANYINDILIANHNASQGVGFLKPSPEKEDLPLDVFDYQKAVTDWAISYVACRDSELIPKFANDPVFSLVFINDKVALFMVKRSFSQMGRAPSS